MADGETFKNHNLSTEKFSNAQRTADGSRRASVPLIGLKTLWFNTGTLCNIACRNCYIESTPENDRLIYLSLSEVERYLEELSTLNWPVEEIAFTGGEPFMNKDCIDMMEAALSRGYKVLTLTNAMRPMMRPTMQSGLLHLKETYGDQLTLRISIDHYTAELHDEERGKGAFEIMRKGILWLGEHGFKLDVAGRTCWNEEEATAREGYAKLFTTLGAKIDAQDPASCVLFPEMDGSEEVPEITTKCWGILNKSPADIMCSNSRMIVHRKGAKRASVVACTLLPYDEAFELGDTLAASKGPVWLNHPHCARFCVLGGGSCSG